MSDNANPSTPDSPVVTTQGAAQSLALDLAQALPGVTLQWSETLGQSRVTVAADQVKNLLRAGHGHGFSQLTDVTCVDRLEYPGASDRYEVVYLLLNVNSGQRLTVCTWLNDPTPTLPSCCDLWFGANWLEREVYDMFGIVFTDHPNFKRLLLPQEFQSFPLRKDYPMEGRGERHNFPIITRAES